MIIKMDHKYQPYIQWSQAPGTDTGKRAWIQRRDSEGDWAKTPGGRYLNFARTNGENGGPSAPVDFPIFSELTDEQILIAFVSHIRGLTEHNPFFR